MNGIKAWAEDDRPREKLLLKGATALSNSELLAILINNGTVDRSAVDLAKELLQKTDNDLQKIGRMSVAELQQLKIKGLGPAKAITIAAALELGVRRNMVEKKKQTITCSKDAAEYLKAVLQHKNFELFLVMFLNAANKVLGYEIISQGGITGTVADPRIILKLALQHNATGLILCHNHPSGGLKPSRADISLTQKIKTGAQLIDIVVNDHIIVSEEGYFSFADDGLM